MAQKYGISDNTISGWLKDKDNIMTKFESSEFGPKSKKMRKAKYEDLEDAVDSWFKKARAGACPISGPILSARAEQLAKKLGMTEWKCSPGWLERFKKRH